jgi:hypothetical protein
VAINALPGQLKEISKSLLHRNCVALIKNRPHYTKLNLVTIHGPSLRASAQFPIGCGADWSAPASMSCRTALLKGQKLLGTEGLVMDLGCSFDQILQMGTSEEVSEVNKLAVVLILYIDNAPSVLTAADLFTTNND